MATPKEGNPLWTLFIFYFTPCDLMRQHRKHLEVPFFAREERQEEFITFTLYWLASLFVVAEGWKSLKISEPTIDGIIDAHWNSLRLFRNAVFHFQPSDRKQTQFFDLSKFAWAEELHVAFRAYFEAQEQAPGQ